jgi:GGDEF domain-containing protein
MNSTVKEKLLKTVFKVSLNDVKIRSSDYVFRFDGLQFAVFLTNIKNEFVVDKIAQKIYESITIPLNFKGNNIIK